MGDYYKHPRLHVEQSLGEGKTVVLPESQTHYLRNVLRRNTGDEVRVFNERDGEWLANLGMTDKKSVIAVCAQQLRGPQARERHLHLLFPPLAKDRLDFLIEKSVELGVTDLHPVITRRSEIRKINEERVRAQIVEAAEQCERHDIPVLHSLIDLSDCLGAWNDAVPLYAALEREDAAPLTLNRHTCGLLIGPPGGFADEEKLLLNAFPFVQAISMGQTILRTETAALYGLSVLRD